MEGRRGGWSKDRSAGTGAGAWLLECLPSIPEALVQAPGRVAQAWNPVTWGWRHDDQKFKIKGWGDSSVSNELAVQTWGLEFESLQNT